MIRFWPPCRTTRSLVQHAAGEETARMPVLFLHIYSGWFAAIVVPMERFNKATWCLVAMYCALSAHGHLMCARYLLTVWTRGICISNFKCPARAIDVALISTLISFFFFVLFCDINHELHGLYSEILRPGSRSPRRLFESAETPHCKPSGKNAAMTQKYYAIANPLMHGNFSSPFPPASDTLWHLQFLVLSLRSLCRRSGAQ